MATPPSTFREPMGAAIPSTKTHVVVREHSGESIRSGDVSIQAVENDPFLSVKQMHYPALVPMVYNTPNTQSHVMPIPARSAFDFFTKYQRQLILTTCKKGNTPCKVVDENDERDEDEDEDEDEDCFLSRLKVGGKEQYKFTEPVMVGKTSKSGVDCKEDPEKKEYGHDKILRGMPNEKELSEIIEKRWEEACPGTKAFFQLEAYNDLGRFKREMDEYHIMLLNGNSAAMSLSSPQMPAVVTENNFSHERKDRTSEYTSPKLTLHPVILNDNGNKQNKKTNGKLTPNNCVPSGKSKPVKDNASNLSESRGNTDIRMDSSIDTETKKRKIDVDGKAKLEADAEDGSMYGYRRPYYEIAPILKEKPSWYRTKNYLSNDALGSIP